MASKPGITPLPSSPSFDNDAASQQLLAEASSPVWRNAAAIAGAKALNAALEIPPRPPALAPPARASGSGRLPKPEKLKRASLPAAGTSGKLEKAGRLKRTSLFSPENRQRKIRGAKMYDLNPSPQKRSSLPAQVAAFEEDEVQETSVAEETEDMVPETSQVQPEADVPGNLAQSDVIAVPDEGPAAGVTVNMPMSPMQARRSDASSTTGKKRGRSPRRRSGESAASARPSDVGTAEIEEAAEPSAINTTPKPKIRSKKEHPTATNIESGDKVPVPKKRRKLNGPKTMDPDATEAEVELAIPNATVRHNAQPRGKPQPEVRVPIRTTRLRIAEAEAAKANDTSATAIVAAASEQPEEPIASFSRTTMTRKAVSRPTKRKATRKTAPLEDGGESGRVDDRDVEDGPQSTDQQTQSDLTDFGNRDEVIENNDVAKNDDGHESGHAQEEYEDEEQGQGDEEHQEQDAEDPESSAARMPIEQWRALSDLEKVLHFKDQVAVRTGVCSTVVGRNIHRACDRARVILSKTGGPSLEDLRMCMTDVTEKLERIGSRVGSDSRTNFKGDAFRYLFRSLVVVFEQIYDLLRSREGEVTQSLAAMQILHPFVHAMRKFKDAMNAWPVRDLQREKGENRLFLDVESYLIVPLRAVEKDFHIQLGVLENAEQNRQTHRNFRREGHEQEYEETTRKIATSDATKQRRKRWQDLHIVRMQCEPDPSRRRRLRFVEPIEVVETDANGDRFERVPFFGERSAPPPRWTAASSGREWTKEQETVLLDALQSSLSLEKIFRKHCGPNGALRDFSVSDFAAKMAWVHSAWAQLSQQHAWEIPEWVKKIPALL